MGDGTQTKVHLLGDTKLTLGARPVVSFNLSVLTSAVAATDTALITSSIVQTDSTAADLVLTLPGCATIELRGAVIITNAGVHMPSFGAFTGYPSLNLRPSVSSKGLQYSVISLLKQLPGTYHFANLSVCTLCSFQIPVFGAALTAEDVSAPDALPMGSTNSQWFIMGNTTAVPNPLPCVLSLNNVSVPAGASLTVGTRSFFPCYNFISAPGSTVLLQSNVTMQVIGSAAFGGSLVAQSFSVVSAANNIDLAGQQGSVLSNCVLKSTGTLANITLWPGAQISITGSVRISASSGSFNLMTASVVNGSAGGGLNTALLSGQTTGFGGINAGCGYPIGLAGCHAAVGSVDGVLVPLTIGGGGSAAQVEGSANTTIPGGGGGAAITIVAETVLLDGTIVVNGAGGTGNGTASATGAGAGGTIYIQAFSMAPSIGTLQV
jgi:hypothetical protein